MMKTKTAGWGSLVIGVLVTIGAGLLLFGCDQSPVGPGTTTTAPIISGTVVAEARGATGSRTTGTADQVWVIPIYMYTSWPGGLSHHSIVKAVPLALTNGTFRFSYGDEAQTDGVTHIAAFEATGENATARFTGQVVLLLVDSSKVTANLEDRKAAFLGFVGMPERSTGGESLIGLPAGRIRGNSDVALGQIAAPQAGVALERRTAATISEVAEHFTDTAATLTTLAYNDNTLKAVLNLVVNTNCQPNLTNGSFTMNPDANVWYFTTTTYHWSWDTAFATTVSAANKTYTFDSARVNSSGNWFWSPVDTTGNGFNEMQYRGFSFYLHANDADLPTSAALYNGQLTITPPETVVQRDGTATAPFQWTTTSPFVNDAVTTGLPSGITNSETGAAPDDLDMYLRTATVASGINIFPGIGHWGGTFANFPWSGTRMRGHAMYPATARAITSGWWDLKTGSTVKAAFNLDTYDPYQSADPATSRAIIGLVPSLELQITEQTVTHNWTRLPYVNVGLGEQSLAIKTVPSLILRWYSYDGTQYQAVPLATVAELVSHMRVNVSYPTNDDDLVYNVLVDGSQTGATAGVTFADSAITITPTQDLYIGAFVITEDNPNFQNYFYVQPTGTTDIRVAEVGTYKAIRMINIEYLLNGMVMSFSFKTFENL